MAFPTRTIFLTGACSGITKQLAPLLAQKGHSLALHGSDKAVIKQVVDECLEKHPHPFSMRNQIKVFGVDTSYTTKVAAASAAWRLGKLDVMINNLSKNEDMGSSHGGTALYSHLRRDGGIVIDIVDAENETLACRHDNIEELKTNTIRYEGEDNAIVSEISNALSYLMSEQGSKVAGHTLRIPQDKTVYDVPSDIENVTVIDTMHKFHSNAGYPGLLYDL